jgi:hypothetical protein
VKTLTTDRTILADAVAQLVEKLHQNFPGIKTKTVLPLEDEDLALEIDVPMSFQPDDVEAWCQKECISLEDKYEVYILPLVLQKR